MSNDTEDRILQAVLQLFEESGLRGATTRRIAELAGVNEVTIFRHFGSKESLLKEAMCRFGAMSSVRSLPAEPLDPRAELEAWVRARLGLLTRNRRMIRKSFSEFEGHPELSAQLRQAPCRVAAELGDYVRALRALGLARDDFEVGAAVSMLMGAMFSDAIHRELMPEMYPFSADEAPSHYVELFLRAIGALGEKR